MKYKKTNPSHIVKPKHYITSNIEDGVFEESMTEVRLKLNKVNRQASRLIHTKLIDSLSNLISSYILNPFQLIGAGLMLVIGGVVFMLFNFYNIYIPNSTIIVIWLFGYLFGTLILIVHNKTNRNK
jgi:hypothetical protein